MYWTDTHAHLYLKDFEADRQQVIERAKAAGVQQIIMPNIDATTIESMLCFEADEPGYCLPAMGLHPCSVKEDFEQQLYVVEDWLSKHNFVAIGEVGTDRYWDTTFWEQQLEALRIQVAWAKRWQLPLIIHCRDSLDPTLDLLETLQDGTLRGVFHCFSGSLQQAERIIGLGFYLGLGGVITFKKANMEEVLRRLPLSRILLETDSPYLAPVPYRGKRNEPSYVLYVARKLADCLQMGLEELSAQTQQNASQLFFASRASSSMRPDEV